MIKIKNKYKTNIAILKQGVCISPKDYYDIDKKDKPWKVYIKVVRPSGEIYFKEFRSIIENGVKIQLNRIKDHRVKVRVAELIKESVIYKIDNNPLMPVLLLYGLEVAKEKYPFLFETKQVEDKAFVSIENAFEKAYSFKDGKEYSSSYMSDLKSLKNRIIKYLGKKKDNNINSLSYELCIDFLEFITEGKSNKTYNNTRVGISIYLSYFKKKRWITENYMEDVGTLKSNPRKNKAFTKDQLNKLWDMMEDNKPLKFFCQHVFYLLRITTTIRLKSKHIVLDDDYFEFKATTKTGNFDKIITEKLIETYKTLDLSDGEKYIFGRNHLISNWDAEEKTRRKRYSDMFKKYKEDLGIDSEELHLYGINSFRHSGHAHLYEGLVKDLKEKGHNDAELRALEEIKVLINKKSVSEVKAYLREINPKLRFDYGKFMK